MKCERREFIRLVSAAAAKVFLGGQPLLAMGEKKDLERKVADKFPRRTLGKTGERISIIAFGGIVVMNAEPEHAARVVAEAVEKGINYFDVAPTYGDAEVKLGPALRPYRDKVLLACKTKKRDRKGAKEELHRSLKRLHTDRFDVYQLHAITDVEKDVKTALGKDGAMEAILEARKQGLVRHIGFTAHSPEAALTAMREFDFDTVMYPINFACHYNSGFEAEVLAEAKKRKMGIIAIKAMAKQRWQGEKDERYRKCWYEPIGGRELARRALSWTLSQGVSTSVPPGEESLYRLAVEIASSCQKPTQDELSELKEIASKCVAVFPG
ncbi:MAG: aldo/keto reductase [Planctomycetota bacterium]|jgi:aryl-alcohol dehydrogenase-like predicted oxidoreductase